MIINKDPKYLDEQSNWFIDEDCRYEELKDVFSEASEVFDEKTALQCNHTKQDNHDPKADPASPGKKLHIITLTKLKCNIELLLQSSTLS